MAVVPGPRGLTGRSESFGYTTGARDRGVASAHIGTTRRGLFHMSQLIEVGAKAPAFTLKDQDGKTHKLSDYKGKTVVLYFYPKDDTPGCTAEACDFRDLAAEFDKMDAVILGVSPDDEKSHDKFVNKYDLNFPLLSDPKTSDGEPKVSAKYGAWGEKKNYGKTYTGIIRSTFVIGPDGKVEKAFGNVRAKGHVDRVLKWFKEDRESE